MEARQVGNPPTAKNGSGDRSAPACDHELSLRFSCPACKQALNVPLRSIGLKVPCPGCKACIKIPHLTPEVSGLEIVQRFFEQAHRGAHTAETQPTAPASASPSVAEAQWEKFAAYASAPPPPRQTSSSSSLPTPPPPIFAQNFPPSRDPIQELVVAEPVAEHRPVYDGRQRRSGGGGLKIPRAAHWASRGIYWGTFLILFFGISVNPVLGVLGFIWLIPMIGWNISQIIPPFFISSIACPGCGEVYPCVDTWKCGCGYQDHRQRHVLKFRCPACHSRIGRTNCQRCGATILIW